MLRRTLIAENPWATIVSQHEGELVASHYPILLDDASEQLAIVTHVGRPDERIHDFRIAVDQQLDLVSTADPLDQPITNKHPAVRNDPELTQLRTNARACRSSQRHELRAVNNCKLLTFLF